MPTEITIEQVYFANTPDSIQEMTFEYKLWSASSWNLIDSGVQVDTDGSILASPLPSVSGLTDGELYYIRAYNECQSPIEYITISAQL